MIGEASVPHVELVGRTRVIPEGSPDYPDGGWVVTKYGDVHPNAWVRGGNLSVTDAAAVENDRTYWYTVVTIGANGRRHAQIDRENCIRCYCCHEMCPEDAIELKSSLLYRFMNS